MHRFFKCAYLRERVRACVRVVCVPWAQVEELRTACRSWSSLYTMRALTTRLNSSGTVANALTHRAIALAPCNYPKVIPDVGRYCAQTCSFSLQCNLVKRVGSREMIHSAGRPLKGFGLLPLSPVGKCFEHLDVTMSFSWLGIPGLLLMVMTT